MTRTACITQLRESIARTDLTATADEIRAAQTTDTPYEETPE
ncbi:hypothetical protein [Streptomyces montanus]|nr:hypothetical protein [Streptomyces montanus]